TGKHTCSVKSFEKAFGINISQLKSEDIDVELISGATIYLECGIARDWRNLQKISLFGVVVIILAGAFLRDWLHIDGLQLLFLQLVLAFIILGPLHLIFKDRAAYFLTF